MQYFWELSTQHGDRTALAWDGGHISYAELDRLAREWKARIESAASGRRPLVALEFSPTVETIAAYIACLQAGYPVLAGEVGTLGADSRIHALWRPDVLVAPKSGALLVQPLDGDPARPPMHADLRLLLSTSGSTGDPKLVRLSAENIGSNAAAIAEYLDLTCADKAMLTLPLFYSYGLSVLHSYLHAGASLVLTGHSVLEPAFWHQLREHEATSLALVPHQFDLLDRSGFAEMDLPSLRYVTQAGGKLAAPSVQRYAGLARTKGWQLFVMYGQTEASPRISYVPPERLLEASDTIGQAIPGGRIYLRDDSGAEITETGVAGELIYTGPNVMMGYGTEPAHLALGKEHDELPTGDIAERTADGYFRIVGRLKRFVKLFGMRVSLDQVEQCLREHGIQGHAVARDDELVVLHLSPDDAAVCKIVADSYELPETAIHAAKIESVPLLASGKPDHAGLKRMAQDVLAHAKTHDSASLRETIAKVTRSARIGPDDTFASLGGDSLGYIHVEIALEEQLGYVPEDWENTPIVQLEALQPRAETSGSRKVGADVLLRIAAISMVVGVHCGVHTLFGGPWMLIMLMGYLMARFQINLLAHGRPLLFAAKMLYPIIPIYIGLMILFDLLFLPVPPDFFLAHGNYLHPQPPRPLGAYWYVSLYTQMIVLLALASLVKPVRDTLQSNPWTLGIFGLAASLAVEFVMLRMFHASGDLFSWPVLHPDSHGLEACLPIFFLGWCLRTAKTRAQWTITALLALPAVTAFSQLSMPLTATLFLAANTILLAFAPAVSFPSRVAVVLQQIATTTLYVYLFHQIVIWVLSKFVSAPALLAVVSILASFALAWACKAAFEVVDERILRGYRSLTAGTQHRAELQA